MDRCEERPHGAAIKNPNAAYLTSSQSLTTPADALRALDKRVTVSANQWRSQICEFREETTLWRWTCVCVLVLIQSSDSQVGGKSSTLVAYTGHAHSVTKDLSTTFHRQCLRFIHPKSGDDLKKTVGLVHSNINPVNRQNHQNLTFNSKLWTSCSDFTMVVRDFFMGQFVMVMLSKFQVSRWK